MNQHIGPAYWPRSSEIAYQNYIIFCAGTDLIRVAAFRAWASNRTLNFKSLKGSYKGQIEDSFIINAKDYDEIKPWILDQESILWLGPISGLGRSAKLVFSNGDEQEIGTFVSTYRDYALKQDSWTLDIAANEYYITK